MNESISVASKRRPAEDYCPDPAVNEVVEPGLCSTMPVVRNFLLCGGRRTTLQSDKQARIIATKTVDPMRIQFFPLAKDYGLPLIIAYCGAGPLPAIYYVVIPYRAT